MLSELSLFKMNKIPNCSGTMLDLVFSSDSLLNTFFRIERLEHSEDPYHPTLDLALTLPTPVQTATDSSKVMYIFVISLKISREIVGFAVCYFWVLVGLFIISHSTMQDTKR